VLHLDHTGRPHATEHDVSLSREDRALGDCIKADPDLIEGLLAYPKDKDSFSISDLGRLRKKRHAEQKAKNQDLQFDSKSNKVGCGEVALFQCVFGKGISYSLPVRYVKAVFKDERLPYDEGWKPRRTPVLFPELAVLLLGILYYASPI
jgi:peroxiredoxin